VAGGDQHHIGAVNGKRAATDRAGNDAGEIEDAQTGKRARTGGELVRRRLADFVDAKQRQLRDRAALRMMIPLREGAARSRDEARFGCAGGSSGRRRNDKAR
jgi:hypothetical protein